MLQIMKEFASGRNHFSTQKDTKTKCTFRTDTQIYKAQRVTLAILSV